MQGGKSASALESAKEAAANVGASAWAGKEKTKAVVQETVAKARASDPEEKAAADARKLERVREVEAAKQDTMRANAAAKERATAADHHPTPPAAGAAVDREVPPPTAGGGHLVGASGAPPGAMETGGAPATGGHVTSAAPTATETGAAATGGHAAGAPEATGAVVNP